MATRRRASRSTLTGNITDLQRRVKYLQAKPVPSKLANQVVTRTAIQPRAVSTDQIALAAITNDQVAADAIKQEQLDALSVGNPELQDDAVLNRNIARDAVNEESIEINSVGNGEMQDDSVGSPEIIDGSVGSAEIADGAVGTSEIALDAVGSEELKPGSVGTNELANGAVTTDKIFGRAVTGDKIAINTIKKNNIDANSVGSSELEASSVRSTELADGAVTTNKIGNLQVTGAKIANGTITFAKTDGQTFSRSVIRNGLTVTSGLLLSTTGQLSPSFGTGANQIARGNHGHAGVIGQALSGVNRHSHSISIGASSKRVKKDIEPYKPQDIKKLLNLEPKKYKYKRSERQAHSRLNKEWMHGYIVEELIDLGFPDPAAYDKKGRPSGIDYSLMSMLVLELVKVQQTEIDLLKEEVLRLKDAK